MLSGIKQRVHSWAYGMVFGALFIGVGFGDLSSWYLIIIGAAIFTLCYWQFLNSLDKLHS